MKWLQAKNFFVFFLCLVLASSIANNVFLLKKSGTLSSQLSDAHDAIASLTSDVEYLDRTRPAPSSAVYDSRFAYQLLYPDFYADPPKEVKEDKYAAYLTFDDGPSSRTPEVLKILAAKDIKATFFVAGNLDEYGKKMAKRIVSEGHSVGMHSFSHNYKKIYAGIEAFLEDMYTNFQQIYEATGVKPTIFRFPAGSLNPYNRAVFVQLVAEMTRRGFLYYDWNVTSGDAAKSIDADGILTNVQQGIKGFNRVIVLMHDSGAHTATVAALPEIIDCIQKAGFHFSPIDNSVKPVIFAFPQEY